MSKRQIVGHHVATSPSVVLRPGDRLVGKHFLIGGALYGRVLFTETEPVVRIERGENDQREVYIAHNLFEALDCISMC